MDRVDAIALAIADALDKIRRRTATVDSVTTATVTVNLPGGGQKTLPYLKGYTPTVGDVVHIDCTLPDAWLVLGTSAP